MNFPSFFQLLFLTILIHSKKCTTSQWVQIISEEAFIFLAPTSVQEKLIFLYESIPSIRDGVLHSGMLLYLHHRDSKIFLHPAKFDNFKDEKISDFKTVSVSQRKNLLY